MEKSVQQDFLKNPEFVKLLTNVFFKAVPEISYEDCENLSFLFAESCLVLTKTGLTPRQLLEQRDDLLDALEIAQKLLSELTNPEVANFNSQDYWVRCVAAESRLRHLHHAIAKTTVEGE